MPLPLPAEVSEVLEPTQTRVVVREHPRTGKPYVSIVDRENAESAGPLPGGEKYSLRPDYRILDPSVKSGDVPYEGPVSSRKKVYALAAGLAAAGAGGAILGAAAAPAAASTAGASGGAGIYAAGGAAVAAGTAGSVAAASRIDPERDDFTHESVSQTS